jgi:chemotaxis signal transduction protein
MAGPALVWSLSTLAAGWGRNDSAALGSGRVSDRSSMTPESPAARSESPALDSPETTGALRFVIASLGPRRFALEAEVVQRIVRMAALVPLLRPTRHVVGMLNLHGTVLLVVDPRRALGIAPARPSAAQQLIVLRARSRYVLWVDRVDEIVIVAPAEVDAVAASGPRALSSGVLHHGGELVPVLAAAALDPGPRKAPRTMPV